MYQEVCFNRGTEAGGEGVNAGHSLSPPPSHFMLATGLWNVQLFCVTFVLECGFLVKKVDVSFSFTLDWFLFLHFFFLQARKIFE